MADWQSGLDDDQAEDNIPQLASPLTSSGQDPDMVRLRMMQGGLTAPDKNAQPSAPANPATASTPTTDMGRQALTDSLRVGGEQEDVANQRGQVDPRIAELQTKREQDATLAPDASNYKPSFGTRVLRGLESVGKGLAVGGLQGAAIGAFDPALVGVKAYGAPTDAYDAALDQNKKAVAGDDQALADAKSQFEQIQAARAARQTGLNEAAGTFDKTATGATGLQNAQSTAAEVPIRREQADAAALAAQNNTPGAKAELTDREIQQRTIQASRMPNLKGEDRLLYILNGKVPDPRQATAEEIASAQAMRTFIKEHGRSPNTLAEYQSIQQAARGATTGGPGGAESANLRAAARLAGARVKDLQDQKSRMNVLGQWTADDEKKLTDATTEASQLQGQLVNGKGGAPPPDGLLSQYNEGDPVYGQNGEVWYKRDGKWTQQ